MPNKGYKQTEEHRINLSKSHLGYKYSKETIEKRKYNAKINPNYGMGNKHHSIEAIKKMKASALNRIRKYKHSKKTIEKIIFSNKKSFTEERRKEIIEMRKNLICPKEDTSIEIKIQSFLEQLGIDYFKHKYINIKHGYQCDILIPSINLIIECDGDYWHKYPIGKEIDKIRTRELLEKGFKVLRLWEFEIREMDVNGFKQKIMELK